MSKPTYKLTLGLAHVITTGEPVYITGIHTDGADEYANFVRPVITQNGIEYRTETMHVAQLETPHAQIKRKLEFDEFVQDLQMKFQEKRYALSNSAKVAIEKHSPFNNKEQGNRPQVLRFNGNGDDTNNG